jgi:hypothetical protein
MAAHAPLQCSGSVTVVLQTVVRPGGANEKQIKQ